MKICPETLVKGQKKIIERFKCKHSQKIILRTDGFHMAILIKWYDKYVSYMP